MKQETLTSRERVKRTLLREPVDRFPIDLGSYMSTGISAFTYRDLRKHLGLSVDIVDVPDVVQCLARVEQDVLERFHIDCIYVEPKWPDPMVWCPREDFQFSIPASANPIGSAETGWTIQREDMQMQMPAGGYYFDGAWLSTWTEDSYEEVVDAYAREAERLHKETDYALNFCGYCFGAAFGGYFGDVFRAVEMIEDPEHVHAVNERLVKEAIGKFDVVNEAMGKWIQLLSIADDMGSQRGPICNPSLLEEMVMPFYQRFCEHVHNNSDIKVFLHSCGSVKPIIPMLIDAGIDILNPVQISADNMKPKELKAEFGDKIVFWGGGCDTQSVLPKATTDELAKHVRETVQIFKPGGGFVFNQVHNILGRVPPENIVTMFDTAWEESFYD